MTVKEITDKGMQRVISFYSCDVRDFLVDNAQTAKTLPDVEDMTLGQFLTCYLHYNGIIGHSGQILEIVEAFQEKVAK